MTFADVTVDNRNYDRTAAKYRGAVRGMMARSGRFMGVFRRREAEVRAFLLRCLLGGLAIRAIREPELDSAVLIEALELVVPPVLN